MQHAQPGMNTLTQRLVRGWASLGPRFLPFADAATPDLPLSRLLRLALFQVSVGMAMVLMVGTLNRVMIVELQVPASLVAVMLSVPVMYAPFRALIGHRSDNHRSELGWRRVPYIWMGTLIQFGGLSIMPFALLVLSGRGHAGEWPAWIGPAGAGVAFLLVGAGLHTTQTAGLSLATDLAPPESQPKVVGLMYVMLLLGTVLSAMVFGHMLAEFSPGRLIQVIQASAITTLVLNTVLQPGLTGAQSGSRPLPHGRCRRLGRHPCFRLDHPVSVFLFDGPFRSGRLGSRLWRRPVQPWHAHRHHEQRPEGTDGPGPGGLGGRASHRCRCRCGPGWYHQ